MQHLPAFVALPDTGTLQAFTQMFTTPMHTPAMTPVEVMVEVLCFEESDTLPIEALRRATSAMFQLKAVFDMNVIGEALRLLVNRDEPPRLLLRAMILAWSTQ